MTPNRANFGNASSNRSAGQRPNTKRGGFGAPSKGSTQAAAYQQSAYSPNEHQPSAEPHNEYRHSNDSRNEYNRQGRKPPRRNSGPRQWENYLRSPVNSVVTQVNAVGQGQIGPRKCPVWTIDVKAGNRCVNALFDTGSPISIISLKLFTQYANYVGSQEAARQVKKVIHTHRALSGHPLPFLGLIDVEVTLGNDVGVVPCYILKETPTALLLGDTFAEIFGARCTVGTATKTRVDGGLDRQVNARSGAI